MKKTLITFMLAAVMIMGVAFSAHAETEGSASAGAAVMSQYVWRGLILSDKYVIQPTIDFSYGDFGANFWANIDSETDELNETDITASYGKSFDKLSVGVGYIYYALAAEDPDTDSASLVLDTEEIYVSLSYDYLITPTFTYYQDIGEGEAGGFATLALDWGMDVNEKVGIGVGALASYNNENLIMGTNEDGDKFSDFYHGEVYGSVSYSEGPFTLELMGAYAKYLSDDSQYVMEQVSLATTEDEEDDVFYYGASLSIGF
ncbi:hypothetical protein GWN43_01985 [Candidatus Bathyarchaeota archaeon]|nr:hypothetical protein [Candidatus Bathyarchaeota archaeon]